MAWLLATSRRCWSQDACRQLAARARKHVAKARPRFDVEPLHAQRIVGAFVQAAMGGDSARLASLLVEDAVVYSDGGGRVSAALKPVFGRERVVRFLIGLARKFYAADPPELRPVRLNGLVGFVVRRAERVEQTVAFELRQECVTAVYVVRNPDKLRHLG